MGASVVHHPMLESKTDVTVLVKEGRIAALGSRSSISLPERAADAADEH